jgi:hypothetical protein
MLKLKANPTFFAAVEIPTPEGAVRIKVEFKHKTKDQYAALVKDWQESGRSNVDAVMEIAVGWSGVEGEFNKDNLVELDQQYHAAAGMIVQTYCRELSQFKLGN